MEHIITLLIVAVIIQGVVEAVKGVLTKWDWLALVLGVTLCPLAGIDVFTTLGITLTVPGLTWLGFYIGSVLTGIVAARGANFVYDLWRRVKDFGDGKPPDEATE